MIPAFADGGEVRTAGGAPALALGDDGGNARTAGETLTETDSDDAPGKGAAVELDVCNALT